MKTITIGSFKGGTGKTTLASVLGTSFALKGFKVRIIELDIFTKVISRFEAARDFADLTRADTKELSLAGGNPDVRDWQAAFRNEIYDATSENYDIVIIDTGSVWKPEVIAAHLVADLVISTVTESPIDLYQFMPSEGPNLQAKHPYIELIELVRRHANQRNDLPFEWMMCINRRSHLITRVGNNVRLRLAEFCQKANIGLIEGLVDRVGYRNMMETGVTAFDDIAGQPLQRSQLAARTEVQNISLAVLEKLDLFETSFDDAMV